LPEHLQQRNVWTVTPNVSATFDSSIRVGVLIFGSTPMKAAKKPQEEAQTELSRLHDGRLRGESYPRIPQCAIIIFRCALDFLTFVLDSKAACSAIHQ